MGLLNSLLNLFAIILLVRLSLPERYLLLSPYAAATDNLLKRIFAFMRSALPLPAKGLCILLLGLLLALQAALAFHKGDAAINFGALASFTFAPQGFFDWFALAALRLLGLYTSLLAANIILRLCHLGRVLPGATGDLLTLAGRPFTSLRLIPLTLCALGLATLYIALCAHAATGLSWPMAQIPAVAQLFQSRGLPNLFDLSHLPLIAQVATLVGYVFIDILIQVQSFMFMLLVILFICALMRAQNSTLFLFDLLRLLCGALPPIRLGSLNLTPLVAYFLYGFTYSLFTAGLFLLIRGVCHVV